MNFQLQLTLNNTAHSELVPLGFETRGGTRARLISKDVIDGHDMKGDVVINYELLGYATEEDLREALVLSMIAKSNEDQYEAAPPSEIVDIPFRVIKHGNVRYSVQYHSVIKDEFEDPRPRTKDGFLYTFEGFACLHGQHDTIDELLEANILGCQVA